MSLYSHPGYLLEKKKLIVLGTAKFQEGMGYIKPLGYSFRYDSLGILFATYDLGTNEVFGTDTAVPDKTSSIIGLEIFQDLEFDLSRRRDGDLYEVLKYTLSNCLSLQSLTIICGDGTSSPSYLSLRREEGLISSGLASRDINFLQMKFVGSVKCYVDLVTAHFPNIEIVSIKSGDRDCVYDSGVIDLTGFKKLKLFKHIAPNDSYMRKKQFILVKYTNGTKRRIYENNTDTKDTASLSFTILGDVSVSIDSC